MKNIPLGSIAMLGPWIMVKLSVTQKHMRRTEISGSLMRPAFPLAHAIRQGMIVTTRTIRYADIRNEPN